MANGDNADNGDPTIAGDDQDIDHTEDDLDETLSDAGDENGDSEVPLKRRERVSKKDKKYIKLYCVHCKRRSITFQVKHTFCTKTARRNTFRTTR